MQDWNSFIDWAMKGILTGVIGFAAHSIHRVLNKLKDSVEKLNVNVATIIEKTGHHEKCIDRLDVRVNRLERTPHHVKPATPAPRPS